jgi:hypothetical protein
MFSINSCSLSLRVQTTITRPSSILSLPSLASSYFAATFCLGGIGIAYTKPGGGCNELLLKGVSNRFYHNNPLVGSPEVKQGEVM